MKGSAIKNRKSSVGNNHTVLLLFFLIMSSGAFLYAGTTGKLAGRIVDKNKEAVIGANVLITGTALGAVSDLDGYYTVINIPPGKYQVRYSCVGFQTQVVRDLIISVDKTTSQDIMLTEAVINTDPVTIIAKKPVVEVNLTSTVASITKEEINVLPVQELKDIVNLQAGVVDGHFRGGRLGEVQYQVDGVSINNPFNNSTSMSLDRSLFQEVQVISGTFDAEYGQAMSGVVNVVLKTGSDKFEWNLESYTGDALFANNTKRGINMDFDPLAANNFQLSLSGPMPFQKTTFLVNFRTAGNHSYIYGEKRFNPWDSADYEKKIYNPSGDGEKIPLSEHREYSGLAKITNRSIKDIEIAYQFLLNTSEGKGYNFAYRYNPDGRKTYNNFSVVHGIDFTHSLSANTFYKVNLRQNYVDYSDYVFEDVYDPKYIEYGQPMSDNNYEDGAIIQGVDLSRYKQRTNAFIVKTSLTSQINRFNMVKFGVDFEYSNIEFGSPGYLVSTNVDGVQILKPRVNEPPDYPDILKFKPINISAFAQDQIEWNDLVVRAGLRMELFDARATLPSDLQNPANAITGAPASTAKDAEKKLSFAPRLGISYPITTSSSIFFAYGHFYQFPPLGDLFSNSDYTVLKELQEGGISYGVLGNPDLKPERTIQYEFGYKNALNDFLGLDVNIFYKDIRDLLGVEFVSTYAAAEYARFTNVDFGNVYGFTIALDQRRMGIISSSIDYTWQMAKGNSSDPRETATRASAGEDPRPRQVPLNWDQRHTLNASISILRPDNFSITSIVKYGSGQPYTPAIGSGFGAELESNSGTKSNFVIIDLRAEKYFQIFGGNLSLFLRIFNVLDTRFANGFLFSDTGSPDYSLNPIGDKITLMNPNRYNAPRRIEIGFSISGITR